MRVPVDQLAAKLQSAQDQIPPIILVNGNEPLLVEEALDELRAALKQLGFTERLKYQLEAGFDWTQITLAGMEMSLFAEKRIIELRVPKTLGQAGTKAIIEYCETPTEDDVLVLIMPSLDNRQRQAKWLKTVDKMGWVVDSPTIAINQFAGWLKQRLQSRALRVENGVVEMLAQQLEGNVLAAAQEIDKLKVLASEGAVTLNLVSESLADQARFDVYALSDVCLMGDYTRALRIKGRLQSEGVEPVIVVWALVREIRTLALLADSIAMGQNKAMLFKQLRIWSKREQAVNAALQRLSAQQWRALLEKAAWLDQSVKGQRYQEPGDIWYQIGSLCADICNVNVLRATA